MIPTTKPLLRLTAGDLMSPAHAVIPEEMSLQGAARLLSRLHVTGAPVIDPQGCCVGVISATDFLRWAEKPPKGLQGARTADDSVCAWQIIETEDLPPETVHHHMTADPVMVGVEMTIGELARMMLDAHIHRVIVVDLEKRPIGIVSTTDLLAAIVRADAVRRSAARREPDGGARGSTETCTH